MPQVITHLRQVIGLRKGLSPSPGLLAAPASETGGSLQRTAPWENKASSSEVDAGSHEENPPKRKIRSGKRR